MVTRQALEHRLHSCFDKTNQRSLKLPQMEGLKVYAGSKYTIF